MEISEHFEGINVTGVRLNEIQHQVERKLEGWFAPQSPKYGQSDINILASTINDADENYLFLVEATYTNKTNPIIPQSLWLEIIHIWGGRVGHDLVMSTVWRYDYVTNDAYVNAKRIAQSVFDAVSDVLA